MRVIDAEGEQRGIMPTHEALKLAEEAGLDLVEVSPKAQPPVCRILDFGKYKYLQKKKTAEAQRGSFKQQLKEIKFRPKTDEHDVNFKLNHVREFLKEGHKVKLTVTYKGREIVHQEFGKNHLDHVAKVILDEGLGTVELGPRLEGRGLLLILAPKG